MNRRLRTFTAALSLVYAVAAHAGSPKFHAAPGLEPVVGRYLVTLDVTVAPELAATSAEALARAYNGQLEPFAGSDLRQFAVSMLPARARALSADPRVREITEIVQSDSALRPPPSNSSARLNGRLTPAPRDISSSGTYAYDGSGNIRFIGSDSFVYDVDGRLKVATVQLSQQSYEYDAFGNRTAAARAANALSCVGGCEAAVTVNHQNNHLAEQSYDEAGNVTSGFGAFYSYDGTGMVTRGIVGSDDRVFIYTADDERIAVRQAASWTWMVRDHGNKVLREFTTLETSASPVVLSIPTWSKDYVWRDGQLLASVSPSASGPATYHYHLDHLGTPRMITTNGGALVAKHAYYPFGADMDITPHESTGEAMKFTGHERDNIAATNASVDYMHARYYNANLGRFLEPDRHLGRSSSPQSWNRYTYAGNDPLKLFDPDGA
jgi:RHS repeat-associated protein